MRAAEPLCQVSQNRRVANLVSVTTLGWGPNWSKVAQADREIKRIL